MRNETPEPLTWDELRQCLAAVNDYLDALPIDKYPQLYEDLDAILGCHADLARQVQVTTQPQLALFPLD